MGTEAEQPDMDSHRNDGVVVVPAPRPRKGLASWALDLLESLAVRLGHDKTKPLHHHPATSPSILLVHAPCEIAYAVGATREFVLLLLS